MQQGLSHGSVCIQFLYSVLHALARYPCNKVGCAGLPVLSFCIVFYTLSGGISVTKLVARSAHIKLLYRVLHALRRYQCNKLGCAGVATLSLCIVVYML